MGINELQHFCFFTSSKRTDQHGNKRIADNALVALTLMIAVSRTEEKEIMTKVIVNLINRKN